MFGQIMLGRNPRGKPDDHGSFNLRTDFCVYKRKGKASVQNEKSLRQEIKIPVQLGRKANTDCRSVLGGIKN